MRIQVEHVGDVTIVTPEGAMQPGQYQDELEVRINELIESGQRKIIFDLTMVSIPTASLMGTFARTYQRLGEPLHLCNQKRIKEFLAQSKLAEVWLYHDTREEALKALQVM